MVDGQQNRRIGFIIQARMKSERLPGKILMPVPLINGKPLLLWILDDLKKSKHASETWVATSTNKENDVLEKFCETNGVFCYRGEEEDVLSRFWGIAKERQFDEIVRLTADNPLLDIAILDQCISYHIHRNNDYTMTDCLPLGMNFEIISSKALLSTQKADLKNSDKEHVTLYIKNSGLYKKEIFVPKSPSKLKKLRLTVDYPADLMVISTVLRMYDSERRISGIRLVTEALNKYPFIFEVNRSNVQKKQFKSEKQEVEYAIEILSNFELIKAAGILKEHEEEDSI